MMLGLSLVRPRRLAARRHISCYILDGSEMAKTNFKSVDEYIATFPVDVQVVLKRVQKAIRQALPGAEEVISYQIPAYKLHGSRVIYFAGWKQHFSLYPANDHLVKAFKKELAPYEVSKGTIRFPLSEPVPVKLVEQIVKFRAKEAAERGSAKGPGPKGEPGSASTKKKLKRGK